MRTPGLLTDCLVEGDPSTVARRRRNRRISLALSLALQTVVVSSLLLTPLLAKTERITWKAATPVLPAPKGLRQQPKPHRGQDVRQQRTGRPQPPAEFTEPPRIPPRVYTGPVGEPPAGEIAQPVGGCSECRPDGVLPPDMFNTTRTAPPLPPSVEPKKQQRLVVSPGVQEALLIHRVEPKYPILAKQIGLQGKVELRALIGRDGTIHSLEVLSGHVLFIEETKRAISQWRYRPTLLGNEPMEVETRITVVFTLQR